MGCPGSKINMAAVLHSGLLKTKTQHIFKIGIHISQFKAAWNVKYITLKVSQHYMKYLLHACFTGFVSGHTRIFFK